MLNPLYGEDEQITPELEKINLKKDIFQCIDPCFL